MSTFRLTFMAPMFSDALEPNGPQYFCWLPDGEADAIRVRSLEPESDVTLWFERRGITVNGFVNYDPKRREVDPEVMSRQGRLEAGHLFGRVEIGEIGNALAASILASRRDDAELQRFGEVIANQAIFPPVDRLVRILRGHFGQYWLTEAHIWNRDRDSLGMHFRNLNARCSVDNGSTWLEFRPTELMFTVRASRVHWGEYLTRDDWIAIKEGMERGYAPSPAAEALGRAQVYMGERNLRVAFMQAVIAFELALSERLRTKWGSSTDLAKWMNAFFRRPVPERLVVACGMIGGIQEHDVVAAARAVETRNRIIHDGWTPAGDAQGGLVALLRVTGNLIGGLTFKFPDPPGGTNQSYGTAQEWKPNAWRRP